MLLPLTHPSGDDDSDDRHLEENDKDNCHGDPSVAAHPGLVVLPQVGHVPSPTTATTSINDVNRWSNRWQNRWSKGHFVHESVYVQIIGLCIGARTVVGLIGSAQAAVCNAKRREEMLIT